MTSAAGQSRRVRRCGTGARACGSRRAALQQHGGGGDTMNERGNNENAQERGEHEHHRLTYSRFELLGSGNDDQRRIVHVLRLGRRCRALFRR